MTVQAETRSDKLRAAHDKLQEAIAEIVSGDDWKRMLNVASKFHNYSFNNQLIYEIPEALDADDHFRFTLWPQATARPDRYSLEIVAPGGDRTTRSLLPMTRKGIGRSQNRLSRIYVP